ncbi:hypothetical protein [Xanthomonas pisi]|uniref:Uncharacterized protein n=1 Tax=Xanthomonas pisi TaxID=56457 RepID=A0A2S7D8R7_9XANT|nr:hypothetical protein [Xanthomonas pisi]KLD70441.1 hypothetical protein Y887_11410 [Xanthomonas pisi DSM 18956]PPU70218.1 hypothetical protein XpiCFBP4643_01250 [Xanthomonas pisi]
MGETSVCVTGYAAVLPALGEDSLQARTDMRTAPSLFQGAAIVAPIAGPGNARVDPAPACGRVRAPRPSATCAQLAHAAAQNAA